MYGLPKDFDGCFLVGRIVQLVCFAHNQIYLHFDKQVIITIESAFSYKTEQIIDVPVQESNLMELVGSAVSVVQGDTNGTLRLLFSNGHTLKVYDTTRQYESYTISYGGTVIIV